MLSRFSLLIVVMLAVGCAGNARRDSGSVADPVELRLSPASLGRELALQQQLVFSFRQSRYTLDALLEVDALEVRLAVQSFGRPVLRLHWDGVALQQRRFDGLPAALRGESVLADLQLTYWSVAAIRAVLPDDWNLSEGDGVRRLYRGGCEIMRIEYLSPQRIEIVRLASGSRLTILSSTIAEPL